MDSEKIQEAISQVASDNIDDFLTSLGALHSNINRAVEMAVLMSAAEEEGGHEEEDGEEDDPYEDEDFGGEWAPKFEDEDEDDTSLLPIEEDGESSGTLTIKDLSDTLETAFGEGGLDAVAERLSEVISGFELSLDNIEPFRGQVELFIAGYGFSGFVRDDFENVAFIISGPEQQPTPKPSEGEGDPGDADVPTIALIKRKKNAKIKEDLSVLQNFFYNANTAQGFYETEESEQSYSNRLLAAQEADDSISALNFHPIFKSLGENAVAFHVDDSQTPPKLIFSVEKMQNIIQAVVSALSTLNDAVKSSNSSLSGASYHQFWEKLDAFEANRKAFADSMDDIAAAIKKRDSYAARMVYKLKEQGVDISEFRTSYKISNAIKDEQSQLFRLFYNLVVLLIFLDGPEPGSEIYQFKLSSQLKETFDQWKNTYREELRHQITNKIKMFFDSSNNDRWLTFSISSYLARSIKRRILQQEAYKKSLGVVTTSWNYADCAVCGIKIYTRKRQDTPGVEGRPSTVNIMEYSEYEDNRYSLFRERDNSLITLEELNAEGPFDPPPTMAGKPRMVWAEIEAMVHSGSKTKHIEGVRRRAWALRHLGARPIPTRKRQISNFKYKCPYSTVTDRPEGLQEVSETRARFNCGLYMDPSPLFGESPQDVTPASLQSTKTDNITDNPEERFEIELDKAVSLGNITEDQKEAFIEELRRRRGGGWKFSNTYFNCPARIVIPEEIRNPIDFKKKHKDYSTRYSYIASPIAGPITEDKVSSGHIRLPVNADGSYADIEEGTMSYLVCGTQTSLSSFSRDLGEEGSLPSLIKEMAARAGADDQYSKTFMTNLVETLIYLGVDVDDILPFISNMSSPEEAVFDLEKSGRLEKISDILATAMASPVNLGHEVGGWTNEEGMETSLNRLDIIGKMKLVCPHRHRFTIEDSVYFGRTHTGINLRNKRRAVYTWGEIIRSGLLFTEGYDNFNNTISLRSKNGSRYVLPVEEWAGAAGDDQRYSYEEWVDRIDKVNKVVFSDHFGEGSYSFGAVPKQYLWGSEERYSLSSTRQRESRDPDTIRTIQDNRTAEIDRGSKKGADGKLRGVDAGTKAAKQKFDNQSSGVSSVFNRAKEDLIEQGAIGLTRVTAPIGKTLKSFIINIQDWLVLSSTLDVRGAMVGPPVLLEATDEHAMLDVARAMIEIAVRDIEEEDEEGVELPVELTTIIETALQKFKERYFSNLKNLDLRLVGLWGKTFDIISNENIIKNVVYSTIEAATEQLGPDQSIYYEKTLLENNILALDHVMSLEYGGRNISSLADSFRDTFIPDLSREQESRILSGNNPGLAIPKMKGKEFMGRVLLVSTALYLADAIARIYNLYMRDQNSKEYIGYSIGLDLSNSEKVLSLSREDLGSLSIGLSADKLKAMSMNEQHIEMFYEIHFDNIVGCISSLQDEVFRMRTACSSHKYMQKAIEYIQGELNTILDDSTALETDIERARLIVNNVMSNPPITTLSLNSNGKYATHFGGRDAAPTDPNSLMPLFGAYLVEYKGKGDFYPIFALTGKGIIYHDFNMNIPEPLSLKNIYVLSNKSLPMSIELEDLYDRIPEEYRQNGWKVFQVSMDSYKMADKKTNAGVKSGVSLIYHPATTAVMEESALMGYQNEELGFDSQSSLFIGPLAIRSGSDNLFPPSPVNGVSNVGVPIPLDYMNNDSKRNKIFPVIGARIPITLPTSRPGDMIELDISDFLLRDPPDAAFQLLREINTAHDKLRQDLDRASEDREREQITERYRDLISSLHSTYRSLPYYVANAKSGTKTERQSIGALDRASVSEKFSPRVSAYLPLVDWVTMHRMISAFNPQFGPDFGGHQLWGADDGSESVNETLEAIEQFIIDVHGLDKLARLIGEALGGRYIDPTDLLDPINRLFRNGSVTRKECAKLFGYKLEDEEASGGYTSIDGFPWMNLTPAGRTSAVNLSGGKMFDRFGSWVKGTSMFYPVGLNNEIDPDTGEPHAYIKILNVIFAPEKERERLRQARDPDSDSILSAKDLYAYEAFEGDPNTQRYFPVPEDPKDLVKFIRVLKKVKHIGAQKYAEALSEYLINHMLTSLAEDFITEDSIINKESIQRIGLIKYSKNLKRHIYRSGIIQSTELNALWEALTK